MPNPFPLEVSGLLLLSSIGQQQQKKGFSHKAHPSLFEFKNATELTPSEGRPGKSALHMLKNVFV